ncbi:Lrp/AsnC family transcriptional regulator [Candidatus Woesearchaeota archaeon]|nr:Lrp/AsnC family transcriptional regulator [Candidatus Woesearchaeota archaeon]
MPKLDAQEEKIVKALIRDPRMSDNQIGKKTGVPIRTVSRKRARLEKEGIISYFVNLNMGHNGTGHFGARHLHIIKFRLGITKSQIIREIMEEKNVKTCFREHIYESHIAEVDGHVALVMIIEGKSDDDIVENFNKFVVPSLRKNHGADCILEISTIRLSDPIRIFHNYVPMLNMKNGKISAEWRDDFMFVE